jgi:D-lactate dehydrogenase (cytochrome)
MIVKKSLDEIENYLTDASNVKGYCDAVYFPEREEEVAEILSMAASEKTGVTVSGNGTGLTGARVPMGGIVISLEKMNRIKEINKEGMYAVVEPGVILSEFLEKTKEKGLLYPPDPTEKNCHIGATVATNASGEKTFKYGPTRDYVSALRVVLASGDIINIKRGEDKAEGGKLIIKSEKGREYIVDLPDFRMPDTKNASGYFIKEGMDAVDLFIGSEGTLGVITEITLKLLPYPEGILSCIIFFNNEEDALGFIEKGRERSLQTRKNKENNIDALALEFFDENALKFLSGDYAQIPKNAGGAVWFEEEIVNGNEDELIERWMELITAFRGNEETAWFAFTEADKKKIEEFRHAISWRIAEYLVQNNVKKLGTDVSVPDAAFRELYFYSKEEVIKASINYVIYGHFGNSHMHLNMLPRDNDEYLKGREIYEKICQKAVKLKGTISAEHGVGKLKNDYLILMYGEEVIVKMKEIKKLLDPNWVLGRGNIFKEE